MGSTYWDFDGDNCEIRTVGLALQPPAEAESSIGCDCNIGNDTFCHVVRMYKSLIESLKLLSLITISMLLRHPALLHTYSSFFAPIFVNFNEVIHYIVYLCFHNIMVV